MSVPTDFPRENITIKVTQQEQMEIEAYITPTPGLVVHRQVRWSPGKEEHKFTSKWQVTHRPSGLGLLTPTKCLDRQKDAFKFARRLKDLKVWDSVTAEELTNDDELLRKVKNIYEGISREQEAEDKGEIVLDEEYQPRYVIERDRKTKQFAVIDSKTKDVIASYPHRGRAWKEAHRLNEEATV